MGKKLANKRSSSTKHTRQPKAAPKKSRPESPLKEAFTEEMDEFVWEYQSDHYLVDSLAVVLAKAALLRARVMFPYDD